jgi:hypothetical protein
MTKTATRITFDTTPFELSHGRSPKGRGSWAFCPFHMRDSHDHLDGFLMSPSMTFTEAKAWAKQQITHRRNARRAADFPAAPWDSELWAVLG